LGGIKLKFRVPEGATPIEESSDLILDGLLTYQDLCTAEAENILSAIDSHFKRKKNIKKNWLTEEYIRKVHRDMFKNVWRWAGIYRKTELNIGVRSHSVREEIAKLCHDVAYWGSNKANMPVLERAIRIHHRLTWIHPFMNGNGRHARLIADIYLYSYNHPRPIWAESSFSNDGDMRSKYLKAIREADHSNFEPLIEFTKQHINHDAV